MVLVGEKTKNLYKFVRWEIELAIKLGLPIIVANLNKTTVRALADGAVRYEPVSDIPIPY